MSSYHSDFREARKEATWTFWRVLWIFVLLSIILGAVGWGMKMLSKPAAVIDKVTDPDSIIFNYEQFYNDYHDSLAMDDQIIQAKQQVTTFEQSAGTDRTKWNREDKTEWNRLQAVVTGIEQQRTSVIQKYNADSSKLTRNLFKAKDLPYRLTVVDGKTVEDLNAN